ncbi:MAG: fumarylacetoacetate hydrolase family protein [Sneathiella sp.]
MRLVSFQTELGHRIGAVSGINVFDLNTLIPSLPHTLREVFAANHLDEIRQVIENNPTADLLPLAGLQLLPPIGDAEKIICIGRNYAAHAKEGGAEPPSYPEIFMRTNRSLIADGSPIIQPICSDKLDFEGELVVVVGKTARHVTEEDALDYVGGYSLFNDATLRDYQRKSTQWTIGKNFDNTGCFGPAIVTPDELPKGAQGLSIQTRLNGKIMQDANTSDLIFPIATLISMLSECLTLIPGDVIVTGTPAGVGYARTPPVWMRAGDVCEISIEGIGTLSNSVENEMRAS